MLIINLCELVTPNSNFYRITAEKKSFSLNLEPLRPICMTKYSQLTHIFFGFQKQKQYAYIMFNIY